MIGAMEFRVTQTDGVTVVSLAGDLDFKSAGPVRRALADLLDHGQAKLVVDLAAVAYIDSSGLGVLVATLKQARGLGGDLRLCALQPDVRSSLVMTGLVNQISVHPGVPEAVASWA